MTELNWPKIRNAIKKRLRYTCEPQDLPDAVQDACGFAHVDIENGTDVGLAIFRAVGRVKVGQSFTWEPARFERWEQADYAGTIWYLANRPGVSEHSARISRGICPEFAPGE